MPERRPQTDPPKTDEPQRVQSTDLGYRDNEEERAYERAEPGSRPPTSSEPEPDNEPPNAG